MKLITGSFYKNKYTFYEKKFDICNVKTVLNGINAEHIILFNTNQYINNTRCNAPYSKNNNTMKYLIHICIVFC
jgi:hypothetical protein